MWGLQNMGVFVVGGFAKSRGGPQVTISTQIPIHPVSVVKVVPAETAIF